MDLYSVKYNIYFMKYLKRFNESNKDQMEKIYKSKWGNHFGKSLDSLNVSVAAGILIHELAGLR